MEKEIFKLLSSTKKMWVTIIAERLNKPILEVEKVLIDSNLFVRRKGQWQLSFWGE